MDKKKNLPAWNPPKEVIDSIVDAINTPIEEFTTTPPWEEEQNASDN